MKRLVIENDHDLPTSFAEYLKSVNNDSLENDRVLIFNAHNEDMQNILAAMSECVVLEFCPTMITFSQYNMLVMAMYKLIREERLGLKELHIYTRVDDIEAELTSLWDGKRMYLDQVLSHIKIFVVYYNRPPREIKI